MRSRNKIGISLDYVNQRFTVSIMGPTGFDSKTNWIVSMPSYEINARKSLFRPFYMAKITTL